MGIREMVLDRARTEGIEIGAEKKGNEMIKNLLAIGKLTIAEIASIANVTEAFVRKVKKGVQ
jgi:hypothetical protein